MKALDNGRDKERESKEEYSKKEHIMKEERENLVGWKANWRKKKKKMMMSWMKVLRHTPGVPLFFRRKRKENPFSQISSRCFIHCPHLFPLSSFAFFFSLNFYFLSSFLQVKFFGADADCTKKMIFPGNLDEW